MTNYSPHFDAKIFLILNYYYYLCTQILLTKVLILNKLTKMKKTLTKLLGGALLALFLVPSNALATPITAKWDFKNKIPSGIENTNIQGAGKTGLVESDVEGICLSILGTTSSVNVKFAASYTSETYNEYAQVNDGTVIRVPVVSTNDEVYIHSYYGTAFTIGGDAGATEKTHKATKTEVLAGYVEIIATGTFYPDLITTTVAYSPVPTQAKWDFTNHSSVALAVVALSKTSTNTPVTANGITMTVNANGKQIGDNGNSIWSYPGLMFKVPVGSTEDVVTVEGFSGYDGYTIDETEYSGTTNYTATTDDVSRGYVEVVNGVGTYKYLVSIAVKQKYSVTTATIGTTGWATFSNTNATDFTKLAGVVDAYQVTGNTGSAIDKSSVTTAAASTGLLLNGAAGTYAIPLTTTGTDLSGTNLLVAVTSDQSVDPAGTGYTNYVLAKSGEDAVFKYFTSAVNIDAGKAYLHLNVADPTNPAHIFFLDDDATGIKAIDNGQFSLRECGVARTIDNYYDLQGRKVAQPTKGLYIVNGKKVVMK